MDPRDDDIEFDFFEDEPATREASTSRVRLPRRGGQGSGTRRPAGPSRGLTPFLRLLAAIVVIVALFVVFGLLIQSCASTSKHDSYANYMGDVAKIAHSSQDDGAAVANALTTAGAKASTIAGTLNGIAEQERQNVKQAQKLDPPGPLRPENQQLIEALQLRVSGVQGLARSLDQLAGKKSGDAALLSEQADRLLASDVVWQDLFKVPAAQQMSKEGVKGVAPPDSKFVANRQLVTESSMTLLVQRLTQGASTGGKPTGIHGTNLVSVVAQPGDQQLSSSDNTVTATTDLKFEVTVEDSGSSQEVGIKVTLTLQKDTGGQPVVQTQKIDVINPSQKKVVTFSGINVSGFFAVKSHLRIDVSPVPGEVKTDNNTASYPVIFSLG